MVLYLCVLIVFSLHRESLKMILVDQPLPEAVLPHNYYAKHVVFYCPLLIQIYWITYYFGSPIGGSDQSSNEPMTSCVYCYCDLSSNRHGDAL
jgi:hypothetical protein